MMDPMDLRPHFIGLEHRKLTPHIVFQTLNWIIVVTIDKDFVARMTPHQQSIINACREKFCLPQQTWLFSPDQVYVEMMEPWSRVRAEIIQVSTGQGVRSRVLGN